VKNPIEKNKKNNRVQSLIQQMLKNKTGKKKKALKRGGIEANLNKSHKTVLIFQTRNL
jgi:hypothetical protein